MNKEAVEEKQQVYKRSENVKSGLPSPYRDLVVVRCTSAKSGPAKSSGNPMVTAEWEICGVPDRQGGVLTEITERGVSYKVAGLNTSPTYFALHNEQSRNKWFEFLDKAQPGIEHDVVAIENPDIQILKDGLLMEATVISSVDYERKALSDEEKAEKLKKGEKPVGDYITDSQGNKRAITSCNIVAWWGVFKGEVKNPY